MDARVDPKTNSPSSIRHDWTVEEALDLFELPFNELLYQAHTVHRSHHNPNHVQLSSLLSVKTGSCPEDCGYCSQSAHYNTELESEKLMDSERVLAAAKKAKAAGASRFCMAAAWRGPHEKDMDALEDMVGKVKALGLETCGSFGLLKDGQAERLRQAGLDYYNHNIDTSEEHYADVISTRTFADRLETLKRVRDAGIHVCCGGIIGMNEERADRASMLCTLATMEEHPESVPINLLIPIPGTPMEAATSVDPFEFVRTIAVARILMPESYVRLSAGRTAMSDELQALCFFAGANSIFLGEKLLTAGNPVPEADEALFGRLGIKGV